MNIRKLVKKKNSTEKNRVGYLDSISRALLVSSYNIIIEIIYI
jgi:hypothetical protein